MFDRILDIVFGPINQEQSTKDDIQKIKENYKNFHQLPIHKRYNDEIMDIYLSEYLRQTNTNDFQNKFELVQSNPCLLKKVMHPLIRIANGQDDISECLSYGIWIRQNYQSNEYRKVATKSSYEVVCELCDQYKERFEKEY